MLVWIRWETDINSMKRGRDVLYGLCLVWVSLSFNKEGSVVAY